MEEEDLKNPATVVIAAYCRLLELEARRWTRTGEFVGLPPGDEADYHKLKLWWADFKGNRFRVMDLVRDLSRNIDAWSEHF